MPADQALTRLRDLCFSFPAVEEKTSHGSPSFFVRGKMFASFADDHHGSGTTAAWCKSDHEATGELVGAEPARYFVPPYVGVKGWVGVHLGARTDWDALALILERGWDSVAPASAREAPVLPPPAMPALNKTDAALSAKARARLEAIASALGPIEVEHDKWFSTFRHGKKPFLYFADNHHGDGIVGAWVRIEPGTCEARVAEDPKRYFKPPYMAARGWLGVRIDLPRVDWKDVETRVAEGFALVAANAPPAKKRAR